MFVKLDSDGDIHVLWLSGQEKLPVKDLIGTSIKSIFPKPIKYLIDCSTIPKHDGSSPMIDTGTSGILIKFGTFVLQTCRWNLCFTLTRKQALLPLRIRLPGFPLQPAEFCDEITGRCSSEDSSMQAIFVLSYESAETSWRPSNRGQTCFLNNPVSSYVWYFYWSPDFLSVPDNFCTFWTEEIRTWKHVAIFLQPSAALWVSIIFIFKTKILLRPDTLVKVI